MKKKGFEFSILVKIGKRLSIWMFFYKIFYYFRFFKAPDSQNAKNKDGGNMREKNRPKIGLQSN